MHRLGRLLAVTLALSGLPAVATAAPVDPASPSPQVVPGEVVVGFTDEASATARARAREVVGADLDRRLGDPDLQLLDVAPGTDVEAAAARLEARRGVAFAEPNYRWGLARSPNDPLYPVGADGFQGQRHLRSIQAASAWDYTTGSSAVRVGVGDTGIDSTHPDLVVTGGGTDPNRHGTEVAGVLAAQGDNGTGIAGTTWRSDLRSYVACAADGTCATADIAAAINAAIGDGVKVLNLSIDTPAGSVPSTAVRTAIERAARPTDATNSDPSDDPANDRLMIVTAAGNDARDVDAAGKASYPCSYPQTPIVCVGGTGGTVNGSYNDGAIYSASNYGATSVDLAAPARFVYTTALAAGTDGRGRYAPISGTSFAAPQVAGVAALLWSAYPTATVADVRRALLDSGDPVATLSGKTVTGDRLNAGKALAVLDTTAPVTTIAQPARTIESAPTTVEWTTSEPATSTSACSLDGGAFTACESPRTLTGLQPGVHTLDVRTTDRHPNVGTTQRATIDVVPSTTIDAATAPEAATSRESATFTWTANEAGATFECALNGADFTACAPGVEYSGLADGAHTFRVRATGVAGTEVDPATWTWTVDGAQPVATWVSRPTGTVTSSTATFEFRAEDESRVTWTCAVDGDDAAPCDSGTTLTGLGEGTHTMEVLPTDAAGNVGTALEAAWTVDTTAPAVTVAGPIEQTQADGDVSIAFTIGGDAATVTCSFGLAGAAVTGEACPEPPVGSAQRVFARQGLGDGEYVLTIRAADEWGNVEPVEVRRTVDTTGPVVTQTAGPGPFAKAGSPAFAWTVSEAGVTVTCALDGTATPCAQNTFAPDGDGLADGPHELVVAATDALGNDATPLRLAWTLDTILPVAPAVTGPIADRPADKPQFTFAPGGGPASPDTDVVGYECRLGAAPFAGCASPLTFDRLASGDRRLDVRALDRAGNTGPARQVPFTVKLPAAPAVRVGPATARPTFALSGADAYECTVDGQATACGTDFALSGLAAGTHTLVVRGSQPFTEAATRTFEVVPLALSVTGRPPSVTTDRTAEIAFSVAGATAVECRVDDGVTTGCGSPLRLADLGVGGHTAEIVATDNAGGRVVQSVGWTVRAAPAPPVASPAPTATPAPTVSPTATPTASPTPGPASTASLQRSALRRFAGRTGVRAARVEPFSLAYRATTAGTLRVRIELRIGRRWTLVASGTRRYTRAGSLRVRVAASKAGVRRLRGAGSRPRLRARATFSPAR